MNKKNNKILKYVGVGVASAILVGGTIFFLQSNKIKDMESSYNSIISQKDAALSLYTEQTIPAYIISREVKAGQTLTIDDYQLASLPSITTPSNVVSDEALVKGKVTKMTLLPNTPITSEMVYDPEELTDDLRKREYNYVRLPVLIDKTDILQMEIVFPNGVNEIIIPKFKLTALDKINNYIFFNASLEDSILMEAAFFDMVVNMAEVKAVQYVDGETQKDSIATYMPNKDVVEFIRSNPNIMAEAKNRYASGKVVREFLEKALEEHIEKSKPERIGAQLPAGSYVGNRFGSNGASVIVVNPEAGQEQPSTETADPSQESPTSTIEFNEPVSTAPPVVTETPDANQDMGEIETPVDDEAASIGEDE